MQVIGKFIETGVFHRASNLPIKRAAATLYASPCFGNKRIKIIVLGHGGVKTVALADFCRGINKAKNWGSVSALTLEIDDLEIIGQCFIAHCPADYRLKQS